MVKLKKAYGINEQQAKKEWFYSGSTVGLQWFKNAWWMNKRQIQNKDIMEVRKRLLGAFNFAKNTQSMTSDSVAKAPEPPKGDKL